MNSVSPFNRKDSLWAVGLMLFALFFGAGNLIFPAYLGQQAGESWFSAINGRTAALQRRTGLAAARNRRLYFRVHPERRAQEKT